VGDDRKPAGALGQFLTADLGRGADDFLRRLRDADEPLALVADLTPHDLLFLLREADDEQRVDLLALADREQVQGVVDLTCWKADHPDLAALGDLIAPLAMASLDGADKALDDLGEELRTLLLRQHAVVHLRENKDDDVPAADGSELIACRDGYYFIELPYPDDVTDLERQLLAALLNRPFEEYQPELECLRHDLLSELEELALRWRNARLADLGFETRVDSLALLSPLDPVQVERAITDATGAPPPLRVEARIPILYGANLGGRAVLDRSLAALAASDDPGYAERSRAIGAELGAMTSRFLTAIGCDLGSLDDVRRGVRLARDTLALGLTAVSGADPERGARALATQVPATLVQAGMGLLAPLRERAQRLLADPRLALQDRRGALLDRQHRVAVEGLARDLPLRWPALDGDAATAAAPREPADGELEGFTDPAEVARAADLLAEAELLPGLIRDTLRFTAVPDTEGVAGSSLVLAALVNLSAGNEPGALPLVTSAAEAFTQRFLDEEDRASTAQAMAALATRCNTAGQDTVDPLNERDPLRRLLLRLVLIGRARIRADEPLVFLPLIS